MKLLLDTHVLLWWLADSRELRPADKRLIAAPQNLVYVSAASVWEVEIKRALGKIEVPVDWADRLSDEGFRLLSVTCQHALHVTKLPPIHRDPFDRMLVAQAQVEGLVLLTYDTIVKQYTG
jgi:PIN domain nuclease of toxin-antitoxin system